ncbi:MAG: hypothetical protein FWE57_02895 [Chitinispirillia bacterium]|nr:hypothetical protein [Chitinispirillia bacterium]
MNRFTKAAFALLFTVCAVSSSYAIAGIGLHWGFDLSMEMKDNKEDVVYTVEDIGRILGSANPFNHPRGPNAGDPFLFISRENWKNSPINFGGKFFIDFVPVIDAIELSCNFGLWQYDGKINYLTVVDNSDPLNPVFGYGEPVLLGLDNVDLSYFSLGGTPYAKLNLDLSVRHKLFALPADIIKFTGGVGASVHFATPLLSSGLISNVIESTRDFDMEGLINGDPFDDKTQKAIVQKIIDGLAEPAFGAHVLLGMQFKLPVIPVGFYVDGKFMIPITDFEDSKAGKDLNGMGLLINAGISLSF